jgi:hypothetical protein
VVDGEGRDRRAENYLESGGFLIGGIFRPTSDGGMLTVGLRVDQTMSHEDAKELLAAVDEHVLREAGS